MSSSENAPKKAQKAQTQQIRQDCYGQYFYPGQLGLPYFPTGLPLGPHFAPMPYSPETTGTPTTMPGEEQYITPPPLFSGEAPAQTVTDINYTAGYLRTLIGRVMNVEFLIGTNTLTDRSGQLVAVGASYIVLRDVVSGSLTMCDLYSIKFVRIYR